MTASNGLAEALAELQTKLPRIEKSEVANVQTQKGSYSYTYADLSNLSAQILPLLGSLSLSFTCRPTWSGERFVLAYRLWHASGEHIDGEYPLPNGGTPQAIGSAITYGRRYCLCAVTGVAPEEDDDGAAAQAQADQQRGTARRTTPASRRSTATPPRAQTARRTQPPAEAPPLPGDGPEAITKPQLAKLHTQLTERGLGHNRDAALAYYAETIGREVESSKELTKVEATKIIDRLSKELPDPTAGDDPWAGDTDA